MIRKKVGVFRSQIQEEKCQLGYGKPSLARQSPATGLKHGLNLLLFGNLFDIVALGQLRLAD